MIESGLAICLFQQRWRIGDWDSAMTYFYDTLYD